MKSINEYLMQAPKVHSTQLNEYLLSKTKTRLLEFPKTPNGKEIENFLVENGFTKIECDDESLAGIIDRMRETSEDGDRYIVNSKEKDGAYAIRIVGAGKLTKANPMYTVTVSDDGELNKIWGAGYCEHTYAAGAKPRFYDSYEQISNDIKRKYKWQ